VRVEIWTEPPADHDTAYHDTAGHDLVRDGELAFPSGRFSIDMSVEEAVRLGLDLPPGAGTYRVRVSAHHRDEVQRRRDEVYAAEPGPGLDAAIDVLDGLETYRFQLWHIDPLPRWDDEED
jgi:hypothetical protein